MATKNKKVTYKASDPEQFTSMYNDVCPKYKELCEGESVELDESNKIVKNWLLNNIIIKE